MLELSRFIFSRTHGSFCAKLIAGMAIGGLLGARGLLDGQNASITAFVMITCAIAGGLGVFLLTVKDAAISLADKYRSGKRSPWKPNLVVVMCYLSLLPISVMLVIGVLMGSGK